MTEPENPALQAQPPGTLAPELFAGHGTALQVLLKNGDTLVDTTEPENPTLQVHPAGTLRPLLLVGHDTALHELE